MSLVSIQNLGKTFIGDSVTYTALEEIDLQIGNEEFYCLLGPSGCSKTTILNILSGFDGPTASSADFEGKPVVGPSRERAVVFQADNSLYDWLSALQNVEFGLRVQG